MINRLLSATATTLTCLFLIAGPVQGRGAAPGEIKEAELPVQARKTLELIQRNGPFPYDRDGIVFGNRERALPAKPRGYYHEYTVRTPGVRGRGAKRIVCGQDREPGRECYYSDDHYQSFRRIR
ncbi:MAG: ribonuclease domain-containing protein [Betaproteobacteria bacterium]